MTAFVGTVSFEVGCCDVSLNKECSKGFQIRAKHMRGLGILRNRCGVACVEGQEPRINANVLYTCCMIKPADTYVSPSPAPEFETTPFRASTVSKDRWATKSRSNSCETSAFWFETTVIGVLPWRSCLL